MFEGFSIQTGDNGFVFAASEQAVDLANFDGGLRAFEFTPAGVGRIGFQFVADALADRLVVFDHQIRELSELRFVACFWAAIPIHQLGNGGALEDKSA